MISSFIKKIFLLPLQIYGNYISYYFPARCRFYPSCSQYSISAIEVHGIFRGAYLSIARILRCHPWHKGGYDPVPEKTPKHNHNCLYHNHTNPETIKDIL